MPALALCLPTLDRGPLFEKTLRSLVAQTFRDLEVVVTDNASSNDEAERSVARVGDPRVRYVRHPARIGMGANWNSGVRLTSAPFVAVVHDDDAYRPRFAERVVARLQEDPSLAFVHTATWHADEEGRAIGPCDHRWPERVEGAQFRHRQALEPGRSLVEAQTVVMRREAFEAAGPFRDDWVQATDVDEWIRLARQGAAGYVSELLVDVRIRRAERKPNPRDVAALAERDELFRLLRLELETPAERARATLAWDRELVARVVSMAVRGDAAVHEALAAFVRTLDPALALAFGRLVDPQAGETPRMLLRAAADLRRRWRERPS